MPAGCTTVAALYGYLHPQDPPETWDADLEITSPQALLALLQGPRDAA